MSPTMYKVAFAGKYECSWNFLILSASNFLICSSNPIGSLLPSLFSECKCCWQLCSTRKRKRKQPKEALYRTHIGQKTEAKTCRFPNCIPGNQHGIQSYSSFVVLIILLFFLSQHEKQDTVGEKLSVCMRDMWHVRCTIAAFYFTKATIISVLKVARR